MKIIAAVSGGVDSIVMLHKLFKLDKYDLVVAHFDHVMRDDSASDARFVEAVANQYGLEFVGLKARAKLRSENDAREARWSFLRKVAKEKGAEMIATGHHQDDVLETMILNLMRGTGRSGIASLKETNEILRPNLSQNKQELYDYALIHKLEWVEDESNNSDTYERNRVRRYILPKLNYYERDSLLRLYEQVLTSNRYLDSLLKSFSQELFTHRDQEISGRRTDFVMLPYSLRKELVRMWWLELLPQDITKRDIEKLAVAIANSSGSSRLDGSKHVKLHIDKTKFTLYLNK